MATPQAALVPVFTHAQRPPPGTTGRPTTLKSNFFPIKFGLYNKTTLYHYDVTFSPEPKNLRVIERIMKMAEATQSLFSEYLPVFDGRRNIFTTRRLPGMPLVFKIDLAQAEGARKKRPDEFKITIVEVAEIPIQSLQEFIGGRNPEVPREVLQALDIAMAFQARKKHFPLGRSFFYPDNSALKKNLGGGCELWLGHFQRVRPTQNGLALNVDVTAATMIKSGSLVEYLVAYMNFRDISDLRPAHAGQLKRALKNLEVQTVHNTGKPPRKYKVIDLGKLSACDEKFQLQDGTTTDVVSYFQKTYNVTLKYPKLPCVIVGNKKFPVSLPMEVAFVVEGQIYKRILSAKQRMGMLDATTSYPKDRMNTISNFVPSGRDDPYLREFGLELEAKMIDAKGRILPVPELKMGNANIRPFNGSWKLDDGRLHEAAKVTSYALLAFGPDQATPSDLCAEFMRDFVRTAGNLGMNFPRENVPVMRQNPNESVVEFIMRAAKPQNNIIFCFLGSDRDSHYEDIKRACETRFGVATQCFDCNKLRDKKKAGKMYQQNIALKVNAKLGGTNQIVAQGLSVMNVPTMIMGADVHHPSPGNNFLPSVAGVVASYNREGTKYHSIVREQRTRLEIIADMKEMTRRHLIAFYRLSGLKPSSIIMFRDGVGEGQFEKMLTAELQDMIDACNELEPGYRPRLTYIIVQKRNHCRLFPISDGDKNGNMVPGVVVDTGITDPVEFDFFLCSHSGLKGTSKPTHYHVLFDENTLGADQVQQLTLNLAHLYARCARSTSIPAPAYYAHLAAYRGRLYNGKTEDDLSDSMSTSSGSSGQAGGSNLNLVTTVESIRQNIYYA